MTDKSEPKHPAEDLPWDSIEMLSQPLVTDEGFLNEACMNELEKVMRDMPETFDRLAGDPEWSTPWLTWDTEIVGALANWAVQLFTGVPPNLEKVLGYTHECLKRESFEKKIEANGHFMVELSLCDINRLLWRYLGDLPQFVDWNDDKKYPDRWVDLSALLRNVCVSIKKGRRHDYVFNKKFEEDWAQRDKDID